MKRTELNSRIIFQELGEVSWTNNHSFEVRTKLRTRLFLSPNTDSDSGKPTQVIVDEISVPERFQRQGNATKAMSTLCQLADKYQFRLDGGPIGFSETLWRDKFVEWVLRFGFERDSNEFSAKVEDPNAFYVRRLPRSTAQ